MRGPRLRLVAINDVYLLDNLPRLRTLLRAPAPEVDLTLCTLAGDFVSPSLLSSLDRGAGMVDCLNAVPVTHVCFGNHEQDVPFDALVERVRQFRGAWINTNLPTFEPALPRCQALTVQGEGTRAVRVGIVGGVTEDPSLYRPKPFGGNAIEPLNDTLLAAAKDLAHAGCCAVIAMTHQSLARDQMLARAQGEPPIPVILGGHEHDAHVEQIGTSWLVKAGSDAVYAAVVNLQWPPVAPGDGPDAPTVTVTLERLADHAPDPELRARADRHLAAVRELAGAVLHRIPPGASLSSVGTRVRQTTVGTLVTSCVRDALGADTCVINGGGIRGARDYADTFTFGDLESELPFPNEVVVVELPGAVLQAALRESRARAPSPSPGFLQIDDRAEVADDGTLRTLAGEAFDPARTYRVATVRVLFDGLDGITALLAFREAHAERIPPADSGRELKLIVVDAFAMALWRSLGRFAAIDADGDARVTVDEIRAAAARVSRDVPHDMLLDGVIHLFDRDGDGAISRDEAAG
ncbi:MAG: 5'-nucleotidase C-terminal domain-containing protein [Polyangiales bacterium]